MKKSIKILSLVLALAIICGALVIGVFAKTASEFNGVKGVTVVEATDLEDLDTSLVVKGTDSATASSTYLPAGTTSTTVREAGRIAADIQGRHGILSVVSSEYEANNKYITFKPGEFVSNGPYISSGYATAPQMKDKTSVITQRYQVMDFDISFPAGRAINYICPNFQLRYINAEGANKTAGKGSIGFIIWSNDTADSKIYIQDNTLESQNTDKACGTLSATEWNHITFVVEMTDAWATADGTACEEGAEGAIAVLDYTGYIIVNNQILSKVYYGNSINFINMKDASAFESKDLRDIVFAEWRTTFSNNAGNEYNKDAIIALDNISWRSINPTDYAKTNELKAALATGVTGSLSGWSDSLYDANDMPFGTLVATIGEGEEIQYFDSLQKAITAAQAGQTVTVHKSTNQPITVSKRISIDTRGYTVGTINAATGFAVKQNGNVYTIVGNYVNLGELDFQSDEVATFNPEEKTEAYHKFTSNGKFSITLTNTDKTVARPGTAQIIEDSFGNKYLRYNWEAEKSAAGDVYIYSNIAENPTSTSCKTPLSERPLHVIDFDFFSPTGKVAKGGTSLIQLMMKYYSSTSDARVFFHNNANSVKAYYDDTTGLNYIKNLNGDKFYLPSNAWTHITTALEAVPSGNGYVTTVHLWLDGEYCGIVGYDASIPEDISAAGAVNLAEVRFNFTAYADENNTSNATAAFDNINIRAFGTDYNNNSNYNEIVAAGGSITEWDDTAYDANYDMPYGNSIISTYDGTEFDRIDEAIAHDKNAAENERRLQIMKNIPETIVLDYATQVLNFDLYDISLATSGLWIIKDQGDGSYVTTELKAPKFEYTSGGKTVIAYSEADPTLQSIIDAADEGTTIYSYEDIVLEGASTDTAVLIISKNLTIDLGGKKLEIKQNAHNSIDISGSASVTFKNGTVYAYNVSAPTKAFPAFNTGSGTTLTLEDIKSYTGGLVYMYKGYNPTVNIVRGEHHMILDANGGWGGLIEMRGYVTFTATDADFYIAKNYLIVACSYNDTSNKTSGHSFTFTGCNIVAPSASTNIIRYMNGNTDIAFNGCYIAASLTPTIYSTDTNNGCPALGNGEITLGKGTYIAESASFSSGLTTIPDGYVSSGVDESKGMTMNYSAGTFGTDFATASSTKTFTFKQKIVNENEIIEKADFIVTVDGILTYLDGTFADAIAAANKATTSATIQLLYDTEYTVSSRVSIKKALTVDLNGKALNIIQTVDNDCAAFCLVSSQQFTIMNGNVSVENTQTSVESNVGKCFPVIQVSSPNVTINLTDVNATSAGFIYNNGGTNMTVNVNGGSYHVVAGVSHSTGAFVESRYNCTVNVSDTDFYLEAGKLVGSLHYKEASGSACSSTFNFTGCDIYRPKATDEVNANVNNYTWINFTGCNIHGSLGSATRNNFDINNSNAIANGVKDPAAENIILGEGTTIAEGSSAKAITVEGLSLVEDTETYTFTLAGITYTKGYTLGDASNSCFVYTRGGITAYARPDRTLAELIGLADANSEILFTKDITIEVLAYSVSTSAYATIKRGLTFNLGGNTLYFSQSHKSNSFFQVSTTSPVIMKNGTVIWNINENYVTECNTKITEANYNNTSYALFSVSSNANLTFKDIKAYGSVLAYSYQGSGITVNIDGGEYHLNTAADLLASGLVDLRANATLNVSNALIDLQRSGTTLFSLASYKQSGSTLKSTATFTNCRIIGANASSNLLIYMNNYTTVTFNGCSIYGSINPTRHNSDNNQVLDENKNVISASTITDPVDGSIILGEGTTILADATMKTGVVVAATNFVLNEASEILNIDIYTQTGGIYDMENITFAISTDSKTYTFTLKVGTPPPPKHTVVFYQENGTTIITTMYVENGTVVVPPTYIPAGAGNGWYKVGFDGWTTSKGSTVKVTDFTITGDTSFYPAETATEGIPTPYLTAAQYNLTFTGSVILNFYLPTEPETVTNIRVTDAEGNPIDYTGVWVTNGGIKTYFRLYEILSVSPTELTTSKKIVVKFDVGGDTLTQNVTLSPIKYTSKILADSNSASPAWSSETHTMMADMVRYANYLSYAANGAYVSELTALTDTYASLLTPLPSRNDFANFTTTMTNLSGYVTSIQFAISDFKPQWIINLNSEKKIVDLSVSVEGYLPLPDEETGVNFGTLIYGVDEENSTFSGSYLTTAYIESMPAYNMDRDIIITVTTESGETVSATYNLDTYFNRMSATGDALYYYQQFLQAFRAFAQSSSYYRYADGIIRENSTEKDFFECGHASALSKAYNLDDGRYCDTCGTYVFFYDDFINYSGKGGAIYTSRDAAMAEMTNSYPSIDFCHAKANTFAKTHPSYHVGCVATPGKVYYLGYPTRYNGNVGEITVSTDTQWTDAYIISDESAIARSDAGYNVNFFCVRGFGITAPDGTSYGTGGEDITSYFTSDIKAGTTKVPFAPGVPMMLYLYDASVKHYIRSGSNGGSSTQTEVILIDEFGNVSNTTPIEWDYTYTTNLQCTLGCTFVDSDSNGACDTCKASKTPVFQVKAYNITEKPIKISGLNANGEISAKFENIPNNNIDVSAYDACNRGIIVRRSNVTVEGLYHIFSEDSTSDTPRQAYNGFVRSWLANNVVIKDMSVWQHISHYQTGGQLLGSYEFSSDDSINVSWINCKVRNFFESDGSLIYLGLFGTNRTRNMYLRDCLLTSFDSHSGAGNVTIEDSTFEHLNFIGAGDIRLNNVTVYQSNKDNAGAAILLRQDYGSRWRGDVYMNNVELRYDPSNYTLFSYIDIVKAYYQNWNFGYGEAAGSNEKPANIYVDNISIMQYARKGTNNTTIEFDENGKVIETTLQKGDKTLGIYNYLNSQLTNDYDYTSINGNNSNPMKCTENIYISNSDVNISYPDHPFFENMNIYIDGTEKTDWYTKRDFSSNSGSTDGCVTEDTLITLADGTQVRVDSLKGDEELLVWNLETGMFDKAPILFIDRENAIECEIIHVYFSDGTEVKIISEHGFWDYDLNKYVYLDRNAADYIGHTFAKQNGDTLDAVQLVDVVIEHKVATAWSPVTAGHLCYFVNGMLSMPGGIEGLFNIFEVDAETMTYDYEAMADDIETYGLYTYEEMNAICPLSEEMFNLAGGAYLKISIGKGYLTEEELIEMINRYSKYF